MSIKLTTKVHGTLREVQCIDDQCPKRTCWQPHDCPIQGAGGVRESHPRWMCLTNALKGCPDNYRERPSDMKEIIAFIILCFIVLWSFVRGYRHCSEGNLITSLIYTFIGAHTLTHVIAKLGEWL